jgi:type I restriction enzyme S subunit
MKICDKQSHELVKMFAEQQEIVRRVEGLFALADQIEARFQKARVQVDKLTPSLLARAFRGHLVPQDPTDEPASVLLKRLKQPC